MSDLLVLARMASARLEHQAEEAREFEALMIDSCVSDHSSLPQNYWHERWELEQKARTARRLVEALR